MNLMFIVWGAIKGGGRGVNEMLLKPLPENLLGDLDGFLGTVNGFLSHLNGFLVSFIVAGVVFFVVSLVTRPGAAEKKSLALFFHPSLD
jgi:hypothetical protein